MINQRPLGRHVNREGYQGRVESGRKSAKLVAVVALVESSGSHEYGEVEW